jgi:hypothetical protein
MAQDTSFDFTQRSSINIDPESLQVAQPGTQSRDPLMQGTQGFGIDNQSLPFSSTDNYYSSNPASANVQNPINSAGGSPLSANMMLVLFLGGLLAWEVFKEK